MLATTALFGSIPAPPFDHIGFFKLYGLMIALGVVAGIYLARRRYAAMGGNPDTVVDIAIWAVPAGLIGSRIYHVITDYSSLYCGKSNGCTNDFFPAAFDIRAGGLGIPGGIAAGVLVGLWVAKRQGADWRALSSAMIPSLPLGQAIGRLGNYFNQELYGRHTSLPWGLQVDPEHRPEDDRGLSHVLYQPTFLYELIWNLLVVVFLIRLDKSKRLKPGFLVVAYLAAYSLGRLWVESLRSDPATLVAGFRVNTWTSGITLLVSLVILAVRGFRSPTERAAALAAGDVVVFDGANDVESALEDEASTDSEGADGDDSDLEASADADRPEPDADLDAHSDDSERVLGDSAAEPGDDAEAEPLGEGSQ